MSRRAVSGEHFAIFAHVEVVRLSSNPADDRTGPATSAPNQRLQHLRGHAPAIHEGGRGNKRAPLHLAAWRDAPYFTDAERAPALALTEAVTRLSDRSDVPDDIWAEAARYYDDRTLAMLFVATAAINVWNRLNVATRQVAFGKLPEPVGSAAR